MLNINGDWASGYWGVGGYGGLLKRVKRSLMTFPDAQYLEYFMIYKLKDLIAYWLSIVKSFEK